MATHPFQPADHLRSRTFLGLLVAQFFAAFNDQAIHAAAMFFAINTGTLSEAQAISLMPILFYAPWALFCTVAGYLADRFSKRLSLVLWKFVEVGITLLALAGFWIGREADPAFGSLLVLATVFLMGMHSAFFVPAKYGAMPEILTPRMLSRGNGVLESLSFLAVILGTVFGGVLSTVFRGQEYLIGVILTLLAVVGAAASLFIEAIPAANAGRPFPRYIYQPLVRNIRELLSARPLVFAVVGIAFFTFLVAYMRAVVYMHGQSQLPPWTESRTSEIVGMVALGIGLGSPLVGYLSGGKVEVGLVPIGAFGMIVATSVAALALDHVPVLVLCIILIGFFTGFYLVPLFSLLQYRAPKTSKGDAIATSNFINITGAIAASVVFASIDWAAVHTGFAPPLPSTGPDHVGLLLGEPEFRNGHPHRVVLDDFIFEAHEDSRPYVLLRIDRDVVPWEDVVVREYGIDGVTYLHVQPADAPPRLIHNKRRLPALLFLSAGAMTLLVMLTLWALLPDVFQRTRIWLRTRFGPRLEVAGMLRLPANGPVLLVTDAGGADLDVLRSAADRVTHFLTPRGAAELEMCRRRGERHLAHSHVVGISLDDGADGALLEHLLRHPTAPVLPVHRGNGMRAGCPETDVVAGVLLPPGTAVETIRAELDRLRADVARRLAANEPLETEPAPH